MFRRLSSQRSHFNVTFPVVKADVRKSWSTLNVACVSVEAKREFRNFTDQPLLPPNKHFGRKDFLPVEAQSSLSFLILLSEPMFAYNHSCGIAAMRANGEIGDDECHTKPAKYMMPFRHHLLYHPKDVGTGDAKRGNHLFRLMLRAPGCWPGRGSSFTKLTATRSSARTRLVLVHGMAAIKS